MMRKLVKLNFLLVSMVVLSHPLYAQDMMLVRAIKHEYRLIKNFFSAPKKVVRRQPFSDEEMQELQGSGKRVAVLAVVGTAAALVGFNKQLVYGWGSSFGKSLSEFYKIAYEKIKEGAQQGREHISQLKEKAKETINGTSYNTPSSNEATIPDEKQEEDVQQLSPKTDEKTETSVKEEAKGHGQSTATPAGANVAGLRAKFTSPSAGTRKVEEVSVEKQSSQPKQSVSLDNKNQVIDKSENSPKKKPNKKQRQKLKRQKELQAALKDIESLEEEEPAEIASAIESAASEESAPLPTSSTPEKDSLETEKKVEKKEFKPVAGNIKIPGRARGLPSAPLKNTEILSSSSVVEVVVNNEPAQLPQTAAQDASGEISTSETIEIDQAQEEVIEDNSATPNKPRFSVMLRGQVGKLKKTDSSKTSSQKEETDNSPLAALANNDSIKKALALSRQKAEEKKKKEALGSVENSADDDEAWKTMTKAQRKEAERQLAALHASIVNRRKAVEGDDGNNTVREAEKSSRPTLAEINERWNKQVAKENK